MTDAEKPFPLEVNGARGEVGLWVGSVPLVIAAEMGGLLHPGTRAQPHIFPIWRSLRAKAKKKINDAVWRGVREAMKK